MSITPEDYGLLVLKFADKMINHLIKKQKKHYDWKSSSIEQLRVKLKEAYQDWQISIKSKKEAEKLVTLTCQAMFLYTRLMEASRDS